MPQSLSEAQTPPLSVLAALVPSLAALDPMLTDRSPTAPPQPHDALIPPHPRTRTRRTARAKQPLQKPRPSAEAPQPSAATKDAVNQTDGLVAAATPDTEAGSFLANSDSHTLDRPPTVPQEPQPEAPKEDDADEDEEEDLVCSVTPVSSAEFAAVVHEVHLAIGQGVLPARIAQGSSGSYFCKDRTGRIVAVFKPRDEEPYGKQNPKWAKWLQRNLAPCCFGRAGIIPNHGYLSEAAASYLDRRLALGIVPRTEVVRLASPSFFYPFVVRWAHRLFKTPLPPKTGSFQLFLNGFRDATTFFREGQKHVRRLAAAAAADADTAAVSTMNSNGSPSIASSSPIAAFRASSIAQSISVPSLQLPISLSFTRLTDSQPPAITTTPEPATNPSGSSDQQPSTSTRPPHPLGWTPSQERQFRVGFERLVVLDYLIRNTDRGSDNWMVKWPRPDPPSASQDASTNTRQRALSESLRSESSPLLDVRRPAARAVSVASGLNGSVNPSEHVISSSAPTRMHVNYGSVDQPAESSLNGSVSTNAMPETAAVQPTLSSETLATAHTAALQAPTQMTLASQLGATTDASTSTSTNENAHRIRIGAIDNGLAFPTHHPDHIRSYPYAWSFLPIAHVPFSPDTAHHVLPALTSASWWHETLHGLETLFRLDPDFKPRLWRNQRAVIRGQAYNLVEELGKTLVGLDQQGDDRDGRGDQDGDAIAHDGASKHAASSTRSVVRATSTPWNLVHRPPVLVHEDVVEEDESDFESDDYDDDSVDSDENTGNRHAPHRRRAHGYHRHRRPDTLDFGEQLAARSAIVRVPSTASIQSVLSASAIPFMEHRHGHDEHDDRRGGRSAPVVANGHYYHRIHDTDIDDGNMSDSDIGINTHRQSSHHRYERSSSVPSLVGLDDQQHRHHRHGRRRRHRSRGRHGHHRNPSSSSYDSSSSRRSMAISSTFMQRQRRKLGRVRRRLVTFVTRRPCFTHW